jgi:hypothetical protein
MKRRTEVAPPDDEKVEARNPTCKCTGGPSNVVPMGEGNIQYPAAFGNYCFEWTPRDPRAAAEAAQGEPELIWIGDGWAYNSVTKMRVMVGAEVDPDRQVLGQNVVLPDGVHIVGFAAEPGVSWPQDGTDWCYVAPECTGAVSDGWHTWTYCASNDGQAWDDRPPVAYPDANVCPIPGYGGASPLLTLLTRKLSPHYADVCVGRDEHNECHEGSGLGGFPQGLVSDVQFTDDMVMLQRAYNAESYDTCVFPAGERDKFCKSQKGAYGESEDLGYIFKTEKSGTVAAYGKYNTEKLDSCFAISGGDEGCGEGEVEDLGVVGYLLDETGWDAWQQCGTQNLKEEKWEVEIEAVVSGEVGESEPNTERVAWMSFNQGVYKTATDNFFQAGIAYVAANGEFNPVKFHKAFSSAPAVVANVVGRADAEAGVLAVTAYSFTADTCCESEWYSPKSNTQLTDGAIINQYTQASSFRGLAWDQDVNMTFDLAGTADVSEVTIGYSGNAEWGVAGPDWVKVYCSMDGTTWEYLSEGADFSGTDINHNDAAIAVEGKCNKVLLEIRFRKDSHKYVFDEVTIKGTNHPATIRQREADTDQFYVKADGEGTVAVHWVAFDATEGHLSSYPFAAGLEDGVGPDGKEMKFADLFPDTTFTQVPLVFGAVATDHADGAVDVRMPNVSSKDVTLSLQGSTTEEKVSYVIYNGMGRSGAVLNAKTDLEMSYAYNVGGWSECEDDGEGEKVWGKRTRTVKCEGTNGEEYSDLYCPGARPEEHEVCQFVTIYIQSAQTGHCLRPKDSAAANYGKVKFGKTCNGKGLWRKIPTNDGDESFWLQDFDSGLCLTSVSSTISKGGALQYRPCDKAGEKGKLKEKKTAVDGEIYYKSKKDTQYCITADGSATAGSAIKWDTGCDDKAKNIFVYVDGSGPMKIAKYESNPTPNAGTVWYTDKGNTLADGAYNSKWDSSGTMVGVGWTTSTTMTFDLEEAGPIQTVVLGYDVKNNWKCKAPKEVSVSCSADGTTFSEKVKHTQGDFTNAGEEYGNLINFHVANVCGSDEKHVRIEAEPEPGDKDNKMAFDEVTVYKAPPSGVYRE